MSRKLTLAFILGFILLSVLVSVFKVQKVKASVAAPNFTLTDIDGNEFTLSDYRGKVVLLDFFATYCTPSVNQFYHLMNLHKEFGEKLVLISISPENETILKDFREAYSINWTIARDTSNVFDMYTVSYTPTLVVIDQDGYIRYRHGGLTEESVLRPEIENLLPKTIYVDNDNVSGLWNGTKEHPYQNITSGLEHASDNDIVFVQNGTYYEHVVVNKSISLIGQDRSTTVIDGNKTGVVVTITKDNVNVTGFTIRNSGFFPWGLPGLYLDNANQCNIAGNHIAVNWYGIRLSSSSNNTICENNIAVNWYGIRLSSSSNNTICENNITNNWYGIPLEGSLNNTISGNNITNNYHGVGLQWSSGNSIYHNNFVDNACQVNITGDSVNVWDDGFPSGGNYWSNYTGFDSDHDGIGDTLQIIDANNNDSCPLMGMFNSFNTSLGKHVNVISNSTIEDFEYFESNSTIKMFVSSMTQNQTHGFCRVCIPHDLMNVTGIDAVIDDGATTVLYPNYTLHDNTTHKWIYFAYDHSTHKIDIVPEFPSLLILPLFIIATLLAVIAYRKKLSMT